MGMLHRFDLSTGLTQFFLVAVILLVIFSVLLTRLTPKKQKGKRGKVDDRFVSREGELIE